MRSSIYSEVILTCKKYSDSEKFLMFCLKMKKEYDQTTGKQHRLLLVLSHFSGIVNFNEFNSISTYVTQVKINSMSYNKAQFLRSK